jgi:glucose/arabinose dehydrogenase
VPEESEDDDSEGEDPWNVGGMGGVPPGYDEDGDPPGELALRFQHIRVDQSGGGTDIVFLPDAPQFLMTLRGGSLLYATLEDGETSVINVWEFQEEFITDGACGPTNVLLDPDFDENSLIYVSYCVDDAVTRLVRYTWSPALGPTQPAVIFETVLEEPLDYWHRFGSMGFEEDGVLWFFLGEHFHPDFAQDFQGPHGALHRIIPNREPGGSGYTPASGNMMMGMGGAGSDLTPFESLYA